MELSYEDGSTETFDVDAVLREGYTYPSATKGKGTTPLKWGDPYKVYELHWSGQR